MNCRRQYIFSSPFTIITLLLLVGACQSPPMEQSDSGTNHSEIEFFSSDSIHIFGDLYTIDKSNTSILLFHQGGSNALAEYSTIIPGLIDRGYNVLAIDLRKGGQTYGGYNRTVANIPTYTFGDGYTYCDAYSNVVGALDYIIEEGFTGKKILWGSSYSASLSIQLAHERSDDIDAVLAFSPGAGGPLAECSPNVYFDQLKVPMIVLRPGKEMEIESVQQQLDSAKIHGHQTYVAQNGVHGSSMLVESRVQGDVSETWAVVDAFLESVD